MGLTRPLCLRMLEIDHYTDLDLNERGILRESI